MKKTFSLIASTFALIMMANNANAQYGNGTYTFESTGINTEFNGSTLTVSGGVVTGFDLKSLRGTLTTGLINNNNPSQFDVAGSGLLYYGKVATAANYGFITEASDPVVAFGNWSGPYLSVGSAAPDSASTMGLLSVAVIGLGACRRFLRQ